MALPGQEEQAELDRFFTLSLDMHCVASADGYFKRVSPAFTQTLGWSVAEMLGRPFLEFVHPDDRAATLREVERQVASGERVLNFENRYQHQDGSWRVLSWKSVPQPGGRMYATARDVTAQRQAEAALRESEARYRTLFQSIDEGFCIIEMLFDAHGNPVDYRFLEINPAFEKQTGLRDAVGKRMRELAPRHEAHWFEMYGRIAVTGEAVRFQNRAAELQRWYDVYAFRFGEPQRQQVAILFSDITEKKEIEARVLQLNAELRQQAAQLEATNKELEAFSYSVSHDLRAPLRHIDGFVNLLRQGTGATLDAKAQRHLGIISDSAQHMGRLIDDLLVFSRMGRAELRSGPVDMRQLMEESRAELAPDIQGRPIVWRIGALPTVQGDRPMLKQVAANLLGNAVKYTRPRERAEIEIGCSNGAGETVFFVRDNGVGFDMRYADKLFGVFQRLHRAEEFEGTGIGLANVQRVVLRHGGRTWAEGAVDKGATFYFTLPSAKETRACPS